MISIAPSILAIEPQNIESIVTAVEKTKGADCLHIDVMDGKFVPQETIFLDPKVIEIIGKTTGIPLDVHLMVENPGFYVQQFIDAGAETLTFHYEAVDNPQELIRDIQTYGARAGIALNPDTPISVIDDILPELDMVLLMSVVPGKCGQEYIDSVTAKIINLKTKIREKGYLADIEVDGGIKVENSYKAINAGADILVSGSGIFSSEKPYEVIDKMEYAILIGSDHGGMELKNKIIGYLQAQGHPYHDIGTHNGDSCDYPDFGKEVACSISEGRDTRGILVCGTGLGISMCANRYEGVRAALIYSDETARLARDHNDANIACFGDRTMDHDEVLKRLDIFLNTPFSEGERHIKRIKKIDTL